MSVKRYKVDFYKDLPTPLAGLVRKVISPKGVRTIIGDKYVYSLKSNKCCQYQGKAFRVTPGLYHVSCICKPEGEVIWNHYLFVVDDDGNGYPVAQYLECVDSLWVKDAIHIVKEYFSETPVKPIKVKRYDKKRDKGTSWKLLKK